MKKIIIIPTLVCICMGTLAQMPTVQLNAKKLQFDDGRQLPAEKAFIITTEVAGTVALIKMQVSDTRFEKKNILTEASWRRKEGDRAFTAIIPNHYKLRSGKDYHFRFLYYRKIQANERKQMIRMLEASAATLMQSNIIEKPDRYKLMISPSDLFNALNEMLETGMTNYETKTSLAPIVFSNIIENLLRSMTRKNMPKDKNGDITNNLKDALMNQVNLEIEMLSNQYEFMIDDMITIPNYPTEKLKHFLALNAGYAGIYNSGGFSDLNYLSGFYAGISFPLGNKTFNGRFWNNASLSTGIFLQDFNISDSVKASGPVVNKPLYVALGYRLFDYLKLHAGTTVLEQVNLNNNNKTVYLKPFIGLSLELNLWLGINKK